MFDRAVAHMALMDISPLPPLIRGRLGMTCPSCGHENPEHAKFCLECASPFPIYASLCWRNSSAMASPGVGVDTGL